METKEKKQQMKMNASKQDEVFIMAIGEKAKEKFPRIDRLGLEMDLTACHLNGNPLRLHDMLNAANIFDFAHDIFGIMDHIDRTTGKLLNCFSPRFSR